MNLRKNMQKVKYSFFLHIELWENRELKKNYIKKGYLYAKTLHIDNIKDKWLELFK